MKTFLGLAFATALIALGLAQGSASAQTLPVNGITGTVNGVANTFTGTFNIQKFALNSSGQLVAIGVLSGSATNSATGAVTSTSAIVAAPVTSAGTQSCPILALTVGPIHLDLLGLAGC